MEIEPRKNKFSIFPVLVITKTINPLTKESQELFDYDWNDYYSVEFGWGKWVYIYNF